MDDNLGPELWVTHEKLKIKKTLWMDKPTSSLKINLNTATYYELAAFLPKDKVAEFIALRDFHGYFDSIHQIEEAGFNLSAK